MKLATIELIKSIYPHPNADLLEIAEVKNFKCIVKKLMFAPGEKIVFIQPDTVLPDAPWAAFYKAKSSRVKAVKLRGVWSEGIIEKLSGIGIDGNTGEDISEKLGVTKYEPPLPQDLQAKGLLPFGMPKTDEERWENLENIPFGEIVDVTRKVDGTSITLYCAKNPETGGWKSGVCGRTLEYKIEAGNMYTRNAKANDLLKNITEFCAESVQLAFRGELCGQGIQTANHNPDSIGQQKIKFFSVYDIDRNRYYRKGSLFYVHKLARKIPNFKTVDLVEENVVLTESIIKKYSEELSEINTLPFEGVVIQGKDFSFKVINKHYDSKK